MKTLPPVLYRLCWTTALFVCTSASATPIDSLRRLIHTSAKDTAKVMWMRKLAIEFHETGEQDSALYYIKSSIATARNAGFPKGMMEGYSFLGHLQGYVGNDTGAFNAFRAGLKVADAYPNQARAVASIHLTACSFFATHGQPGRGLDYGLKALGYYRRVGDTLGAMKAINNLGFAYKQTVQLDSALSCNQQYLRFALRRGSERDILKGYQTVGFAFFEVNKLDSATHYFQKAIAIAGKLNKIEDVIRMTGALAEIKIEQGQYAEARSLLQKILPAATALSYTDEVDILWRLAFNELEDKKYDQAIAYAEKAFNKSGGVENRYSRGMSAQILARSYEAVGKYKQGMFYLRQWKAVEDSAITEIQNAKLADLKANFEISSQQEQISLLEREAEAEKQASRARLWLSVVLGLALLGAVVSAVLLYRGVQKRQRLNEALEAQKNKLEVANITKNRLFSVISHDLKGPLSSAYGGMQLLQNPQFPEANRMPLLEASTQRLQTTLTLLESLLAWSAAQFHQTRIVPTTFSLADATREAQSAVRHAAEQKGIELLNEAPETAKLHADYPSVVTIIRNLLSNAVKFTPTGGKITVGLHTQENGFAEWFVRDTGVGMTEEQLAKLWGLPTSTRGTGGEPGTGIGLSLCKSLAESNGGSIRVESELGVGTTFLVRLPAQGPA